VVTKTARGRRILVTGGAGFVGSHLVERLIAEEHEVVVVDNLSTGNRDNLAHVIRHTEFRHLDVCGPDLEQLLSDQAFDIIFHLAANAYVPPSVERPDWDFDTNLMATFRLLEMLRRSRWQGTLVYASSAAVYGNPARIPVQEADPTVPVSPYGVSKLASERYIAVYAQLYGLRAASLRLFSVFGPRQRKQVVYDFIRKLHDNPRELYMYGDGSQVRDFNYVQNMVDAALLIAERGKLEGEVYNVASGRACSTLELARAICAVMGIQPEIKFSGSVRPGDPEKWIADIGVLKSLGYRVRVSLEEGIKRTIEWYRDIFKK